MIERVEGSLGLGVRERDSSPSSSKMSSPAVRRGVVSPSGDVTSSLDSLEPGPTGCGKGQMAL